jgi:hypothetical protein
MVSRRIVLEMINLDERECIREFLHAPEFRERATSSRRPRDGGEC